jgi:hypothetical protein
VPIVLPRLLKQFFLSMGTLSYVGVLAFALSQLWEYFPPNEMILPLELLTGLGLAMTIWGMVARGSVGFYTAGGFMIFGFALGALGVLGWTVSITENSHIAGVCSYSKIMPTDPYAQWACPEVAASNLVTWTLMAGLLIPSLLFIGVPSLAIRQRHQTAKRTESYRPGHNPVNSPASTGRTS